MRYNKDAILSFLILVYFIVRTHGIAGFLQSIWTIPLFFIIMGSFLEIKQAYISIILRNAKWIIISLIILGVSIIFKHGNWKLYYTFTILTISIPFFIIGFRWGYNNLEKYLNYILKTYFIFISLFLLIKLFQVNSFNVIDKDLLGSLFYSQSGTLNNLVFFWPFTIIISAIAFINILSTARSAYLRSLYIFLFSIVVFSSLISGFAAPVFMLVITFVVYFFLKFQNKKKLIIILITPIILLFFLFIILLLGSESMGNFGDTTSKSEGIFLFFKYKHTDTNHVLDQITSNRWTGIQYSLEQFFKKPFFGYGAYYERVNIFGNINKYTTVSGEHSFVFDTLAFYGVFGIPIIYMLLNFVTSTRKVFIINMNKHINP